MAALTLFLACNPAPQAPPVDTRTPSESVLYKDMQTLWLQHMEWTYAAVAALALDAPNVAETADRLMRNQEDIGNAIRAYYGDEAGDALTVLLKEHIAGAVDIVVAAKAGDTAALNAAIEAEYINARQIGEFLEAANPEHWSGTTMQDMMKGHIDQTLVYATDMLEGRYADAISNYDVAEAHMVHMGDMLAEGIIAQFPDRFTE